MNKFVTSTLQPFRCYDNLPEPARLFFFVFVVILPAIILNLVTLSGGSLWYLGVSVAWLFFWVILRCVYLRS